MNQSKKSYWFKAGKHKYSWGLPLVWQGWLTTFLFFVGVFITVEYVLPISELLFFVISLLLAACLFGVCLVKGEPTSD